MNHGALVHVVDDEAAVREVVVELVESIGLCGCGHESADEFLQAYRAGGQQCLITDVRLPAMSGLQLFEEMKRRSIDIPVIFISGYADVTTAVSALHQGAADFLEKPLRAQVLLDRVQHCLAGESAKAKRKRAQESWHQKQEQLSDRERTVFGLMRSGKTPKEIGEELGLSCKTVYFHQENLLRKLGSGNVRHLLAHATDFEPAMAG